MKLRKQHSKEVSGDGDFQDLDQPAHRTLGKDPSRYRGSQESLLGRVLQGKALYTVNTVVDINKLVSLESNHSVGCDDCSHIHFPLIVRIGQKGEPSKVSGNK